MVNKILHTKFGKAKINNRGYYVITSGKEGNNRKLLHRLVWEDFYSRSIPEGYDIHHKDGNKLNNEIWNLQCCESSKHRRFHRKGKTVSDETKQKISESRNTSGYLNINKVKHKDCKQGFTWRYQYYDENGKRKSIYSVDIKKLEEKVKAKGLKWLKLKNK